MKPKRTSELISRTRTLVSAPLCEVVDNRAGLLIFFVALLDVLGLSKLGVDVMRLGG